jgi:hypothetical protein
MKKTLSNQAGTPIFKERQTTSKPNWLIGAELLKPAPTSRPMSNEKLKSVLACSLSEL